MVVILDNIRSLENVGSIFRTADALGVQKIYLTGITSAPVDVFGHIRPKLGKVSLGAESHVPWEKKASAANVIKKLKSEGYRILAIEQSPYSIPYWGYSSNGRPSHRRDSEKIALVLGNEVRGLSSAVLKRCDNILEIPMRGIKESLNVSVAFGIVGFHLRYGKR